MISIDGTSGECTWARYRCRLAGRGYFEELSADADELVRAVDRIMRHADGTAASACTPTPTPARMRPGPPVRRRGVGLGRTEHMFLGERRQLVEDLILAEDDEERQPRSTPSGRCSAATSCGSSTRWTAAGHYPADRPAAARVPARPHRPVGQGRAGRRQGHREGPQAARRGAPAARAEPDARPARRPARLVIPGLFAMQVRAIAHAAAELKKAGGDPRPEIMIPLAASVQEMEIAKEATARCSPRSRRRPASTCTP